jgi:hypothetical protein
MWSDPVVITRVDRKNPAQMDFAEDDNVIEAFPADPSDTAFLSQIL